MNIFSIVSFPYYLWKIEIPKKISASVQCIGEKYGTSRDLKELDVELRWNFELTEEEQVSLKNGGKVEKSPIFELVEKSSKGILRDVLENERWGYITLGQKNGKTLLEVGWAKIVEEVNEHGKGSVIDFVLTFGCQIENVLKGRRLNHDSYLWITDEIQEKRWVLGDINETDTSAWLDACSTDKKEEEVTCDLKVIIRNF